MPSSPSLAQSIAARILDTLEPDRVERIRQALQKAIADRRLPGVEPRDHGDIGKESPQHPRPLKPPSPIPETLDAHPSPQGKDAEDLAGNRVAIQVSFDPCTKVSHPNDRGGEL